MTAEALPRGRASSFSASGDAGDGLELGGKDGGLRCRNLAAPTFADKGRGLPLKNGLCPKHREVAGFGLLLGAPEQHRVRKKPPSKFLEQPLATSSLGLHDDNFVRGTMKGLKPSEHSGHAQTAAPKGCCKGREQTPGSLSEAFFASERFQANQGFQGQSIARGDRTVVVGFVPMLLANTVWIIAAIRCEP